MIRNHKNYSIHLRKDGRYFAIVTDQGHRTYFYGRTKKEVQQKLEVFVDKLNATAQLQHEINNHTKYMSLKSWAYLCLNTYCIARIQGNTYASYERFVRLYLGELGDMPIGRITSLMIRNHITNSSLLVNENGLSENHLTRIRTFLHMIFEYAIQNNLIIHNPTTGVRIPKTGICENCALTHEEAKRLIQVTRSSDNIIMFCVILCLYTGLRRGEILGLKWCDVDFTSKTIFVSKQLVREYKINSEDEIKTRFEPKQPKTKNTKRSIHMIEPLANEFLEYKENCCVGRLKVGLPIQKTILSFPVKTTPEWNRKLSTINIRNY